ncbi:hypothetical protein HHI36_000078, partial [Cryptolaemus montrouzieri]
TNEMLHVSMNSTNAKTSEDILGTFGLTSKKEPSKTLGPLLSYANPSQVNSTNNISRDNPFIHTSSNQSPTDPNSNSVIDGNLDTQTVTSPNHITPTSGHNFSEFGSILVTPLPPTETIPHENEMSNFVNDQIKKVVQNRPTKPSVMVPQQIHILGKGNPEDILNFVNNHPELTNYPSGSVLEIHKITPQNPLENQIIVHPQIPNVHIPHPHLLHQIAQQGPLNNGLPPGISLEQILEELHKNTHGASPVSNAPQQHGNPALILPQHTGLNIPNYTVSGKRLGLKTLVSGWDYLLLPFCKYHEIFCTLLNSE